MNDEIIHTLTIISAFTVIVDWLVYGPCSPFYTGRNLRGPEGAAALRAMQAHAGRTWVSTEQYAD